MKIYNQKNIKQQTTQKNKIIIGLVGEIASGKDSVADYLEKKYNSQTISFSQPLRDILDRIYLPQTRKNMSDLGKCLRKTFGEDVLAKAIAEEVKASKKPVTCLPNVRLENDIPEIKKMKNFYLIHIDTDPKIRYQRLINRSQNVDDKTKTWEQFQKDSKLYTERNIRNIAKKAKWKIENNGGYQKLYKQVDEVMKQIKV